MTVQGRTFFTKTFELEVIFLPEEDPEDTGRRLPQTQEYKQLMYINENITAAVRTGSVASARHVGDVNFNWNGDGLFNNLWDGLGNIGDFLVSNHDFLKQFKK